MSGPIRRPYTQEEDAYLMKYIANYNPGGENRLGNVLYKKLVENAQGKWPWSKRHSWQSWRERYKDNRDRFDYQIRQYQKKKGIKPAGKKDEKLTLREMERRAAREASSSNVNDDNANADSDFSNPDPPTLRRVKKVPATQQNDREEGDENEEPRSVQEAPSQQPHKMLATRPARKTAIVTTYHGTEDGEIVSVEDGEIVSGGEDHASDRKRKADGVTVPSGSKRQRIQSDVSVNGPPVTSTTPGPSQNGSMKKSQDSSQSKIGNILDDKQTLARLLEALQSDPKGQNQTIEFLTSRLSGAGPSSSAQANTNDKERLYPQLGEEDYDVAGPVTANEDVPGSWNGIEEAVTSTPANPSRQANGGPGSNPTANGAPVTPKAKANDSRKSSGSPPKTKRAVSNKKVDEGFFETPSPTPEQADVAQFGTPSRAPPEIIDSGENKENNPIGSSPLSKRDSPQEKGSITTSFVPSFRKPAVPRRKAPDLDSGSDTEVIAEEAHPVREMNRRETPKESWPPLRKKTSQVNESPPRADREVQRAVITEPTEVPSKAAPISKVVEPAPREPPKVASQPRKPDAPSSRSVMSKSIDKSQNGIGAIKAPTDKVAPSQKPQPSQTSIIRPDREAPKAGPSRINSVPLRPTSSEKLNRTEIHASRSEARAPNVHSASASMSTESDPFLTKDHASRLRRIEKGKAKEVPASDKTRAIQEAETRADRRKTFAGFPTLRPPEIDLRKKALRTSVVGNSSNVARRLSFSPSVAIQGDEEQDGEDEENRIRRRASVKATIDLSQDFPSPDMNIPPADHAFIMRAGVQVLLQSIAQNHSVSEDFVRGIYEELLDLQATDRVVSKMRQIAERAVEEELEREKRRKRNSDVATVPISRGSSAGRQGPNNAHEVDISALSNPVRGRSVSGPRHSKLLITPADEDPTFVHLRSQYVPPSTSRAARFVRRRARRSSGLASSPLNAYDNSEEHIQVDDYEDDEKEEEEVFLALTPGRGLNDAMESFPSDQLDASGGPGSSNKVQEANTSASRQWTIEEDEILLSGDDEEAIKAIEQRRGKRAVKWRMAELSAGDLLS